MVVLADDMNGHVGSSNVGYDGIHSGFAYGANNQLLIAQSLSNAYHQNYKHQIMLA